MAVEYGTFVPQGWRMEMQHLQGGQSQWNALTASARALEDAGYDSLWLYDHFHTVPRPAMEPTFECWSTMAALSQVTSRVRLGQLVTCSAYRNPAYLAKLASCVDVMSGGRVDLGLGAGWKTEEFEAYEYPFAGIRERLDRMEDTARICRAMFNDEKATVEGVHHRVTDAINEPKPVQAGGPPIWIGTQGEKVGLRMVAEVADGWNHNRGPDEYERKREILAGHCRDRGRDPDSVRISVENTCVIYESEAELRDFAARWWPHYNEKQLTKFLANCWTGRAEDIAAEIRFFTERGASLVICWFQDLCDAGGEDSQARRFMREVVPLV